MKNLPLHNLLYMNAMYFRCVVFTQIKNEFETDRDRQTDRNSYRAYVNIGVYRCKMYTHR